MHLVYGLYLIYGVSIFVTTVAGALVQRKYPRAGPPLALLAIMVAIWIYLPGFHFTWRVGESIAAIAVTATPAAAACLTLMATRRWWLAFRMLAALFMGAVVAPMVFSVVTSLRCGSNTPC